MGEASRLKSFKRKKIDLTDRLHWTLINNLLRENDVVYFGDIKSHDIVKEYCHHGTRTLHDKDVLMLLTNQ